METTKGEWVFENNEHEIVIYSKTEATSNYDGAICHISGYTYVDVSDENNAKLICDAGNIHNETGLTPSQLLEQRDELRDEIEAVDDLLNFLWESLVPVKTKENDLLKQFKAMSFRRQQIKNLIQKTTPVSAS